MKKVLAALALMTCSLHAAGFPNNQNPVSDLDQTRTINRMQNAATGTNNPNSQMINNPESNPNSSITNPNQPNPTSPTLNPTYTQPENQSGFRNSPNNTSKQTASVEEQMNSVQANTKYPQDIANTFKDKEINNRIRNRISGWFADDYKFIILNTNNGVVTLSGTVEKLETANDLADHIRKIEGVKDVRNNISVQKAK